MRVRLLLLLLLILGTPEARACYCVGDFAELVRREATTARIIFVGRVVSMTHRIVALPKHEGETVLYRVVLAPQQVWKGRRRQTITLEVGIRECDMGFEVGREYVVLAQPSGPQLSANHCTSARKEDAASIISALDLWAAN